MSGKGRLKKAYYGTITSVLYQIISMSCGFILPRLILKYFGSSYNGVTSSITHFFSVFSIFTTGIQGSTRVVLYHSLAKNDRAHTSAIMRANVNYYRRLSLLLIGYIAVLAIIFPHLLSENNISDRDIILLVIITGLGSFLQYYFGNAYKALLAADQASYILNILQSATVLISTAFSAIIISCVGSLILVKLGSGVAYALNPIVLHIYVRAHYKLDNTVAPDNSALKGRWDVLANSFANIVHENVDIFFITMFCAASEVSVYSVYNLVSSGLVRLMQIFTNGVEGAFGNMWAKHEVSTIARNFRKYEYVMFAVADILTTCMFVLILPFVKIYTNKVTDADYVRPVFALLLTTALLTMCIRTPYVTLVQAAGHYKQTKGGSFAEAVLNMILTFCLVPFYGIDGAIVGTIVANTFRTIQYGYYVSKHIIDRPYAVFLLRATWLVITAIVSVFLSSFLCRNISVQNWIQWLMMAFACFSIHAAVLAVSSLLFYRNDFIDLARAAMRVTGIVKRK